MSVSALLRGIYDTLLKDTSISEESIGINEDGRPAIVFPNYYVSVHLTNWSPGSPSVNTGLYEVYSIACTVTRRLSPIPVAKVIPLYFVEQVEGIEKVVREINKTIDKNYELLTIANHYLHNDRDWIVEPLRWAGTTVPRVVGADWLWSTTDKDRAALVTTSNFIGAGRDQGFDNVE